MVQVHYKIKELVAKYGVRRNFRVLFPNGERADLTSADIIDDTVELSESVCSETIFRFGCIERSMLSFECMGVENIQGCQIRAGLEIDISSLSSWIPYIQQEIDRGYDDGVIVLEADSDLGYSYYRIPYGLYWVESCPRDQSNRKRRKVTAYSADINKVSPVERVRLATYGPLNETFFAYPYQLAAVNAGWLTPDMFDAWGFRRNTGSSYNYYTWVQIQNAASTETKSFSVTEGGHTYEVTIAAKYAVIDYSERMSGSNTCELGQVNLSGWDTDAAWYDYQKFFADNGVSEPAVAAHTRLPRTYLQPHLTYDKEDQYGGSKYDHSPVYWFPDYGCPFYMQVFRTSASLKANGAVRLMWDMNVAFAVDGVTQESKSYFPASEVEASIYQISSRSYDFNIDSRMYYKATDKYVSGSTTYYSFVGSYASDKALAPYLELFARHIRVDRAGLPQIIRLNNASPTAIPAENIESIFWEDAQISPIGEVDWRRKDPSSAEPDDTITGTDYVGNDGTSIYKMLNNAYLLQNDFGFSPVASYFIPWLGQTEFTPFEAVIHDLPWMQPGDAIELATADGDTPTLTSFILTQKIRGIKSLRQEITASGGATFFENNAMVDGVAAIYGDQNASL